MVDAGSDESKEPAWKRLTKGEERWPVSVAAVVALVMQATLPDHLVAGPKWLLPAVGGVLLAALFAANPRRMDRVSTLLEAGGFAVALVISVANAASAALLVSNLVGGTEHQHPSDLLVSAGAVWLTNVIAFALWYFELDRGGPVERAHAKKPFPDFLFPQMASPKLAPDDWEPRFIDYLYLSFTNATAFSPTDVMPLSRWAKLTMLVQSAVSLVTVALVIARAVNILS